MLRTGIANTVCFVQPKSAITKLTQFTGRCSHTALLLQASLLFLLFCFQASCRALYFFLFATHQERTIVRTAYTLLSTFHICPRKVLSQRPKPEEAP